jgi:hypothetical protein
MKHSFLSLNDFNKYLILTLCKNNNITFLDHTTKEILTLSNLDLLIKFQKLFMSCSDKLKTNSTLVNLIVKKS